MSRTKHNKPVEEDHDKEGEVASEFSEAASELVRSLEAQRDEAVAARQRALADFANYQKRAAEGERRALQTGAARLAKSLLPVLDNFDLALDQDPKQVTVEQLFGGVKIVRDELVKSLAAHGLERINPRQNDEFDPNRHEAMMRVDTPEVAPGRVVATLQVGYAMADQVLRPAKVSIASEASPLEGTTETEDLSEKE